jgi:hypothetical protein
MQALSQDSINAINAIQAEVTAQIKAEAKQNLQLLYLDYMNNFLTVSKFAEHYNMDERTALLVIEEGEQVHAAYIFNKANKF